MTQLEFTFKSVHRNLIEYFSSFVLNIHRSSVTYGASKCGYCLIPVSHVVKCLLYWIACQMFSIWMLVSSFKVMVIVTICILPYIIK